MTNKLDPEGILAAVQQLGKAAVSSNVAYGSLAEKVITAYLSATTNPLQDAICILEDGAEPEIGDFLSYKDVCTNSEVTWEYAKRFGVPRLVVTDDEFFSETGSQFWRQCLRNAISDCQRLEARIIQRQGRPVIYRSQLTKGEK